MPQLTPQQVAQVAYDAGFRGPALETFVAIAWRESRGNSDAIGDKDNPRKGCGSYGLWQINVCPNSSAGPPRHADNPRALLDPRTAAASAFLLSNGGANTQPWLSYRSGVGEATILPFRPLAKEAIAKIGQGSSSAPSSTSDSSTSGGGGLGEGLSFLTSGSTWVRVAAFIGGAALLMLAVVLYTSDVTMDAIT